MRFQIDPRIEFPKLLLILLLAAVVTFLYGTLTGGGQ